MTNKCRNCHAGRYHQTPFSTHVIWRRGADIYTLGYPRTDKQNRRGILDRPQNLFAALGEGDAECTCIPVMTIDDVEDDESGGVDDAKSSETRHRDEQRQRDSAELITNVITRQAGLHVHRYNCQSPQTPNTWLTQLVNASESINRITVAAFLPQVAEKLWSHNHTASSGVFRGRMIGATAAPRFWCDRDFLKIILHCFVSFISRLNRTIRIPRRLVIVHVFCLLKLRQNAAKPIILGTNNDFSSGAGAIP